MTQSLELQCAVWHSVFQVSDIVDVVHMTPKTCWSSGALNVKTGLVRDRTYCRFYLGHFSQDELSGNLEMLTPFEDLVKLEGFSNGGGKIAVYVKDESENVEVYLSAAGVNALHRLSAMIVFR